MVEGVPKKIIPVIVHEFTVDDSHAEIDQAESFRTWKYSEVGQWVSSHSVEMPTWHTLIDHYQFCQHHKILAKLYEPDAVYFNLKWK